MKLHNKNHTLHNRLCAKYTFCAVFVRTSISVAMHNKNHTLHNGLCAKYTFCAVRTSISVAMHNDPSVLICYIYTFFVKYAFTNDVSNVYLRCVCVCVLVFNNCLMC